LLLLLLPPLFWHTCKEFMVQTPPITTKPLDLTKKKQK